MAEDWLKSLTPRSLIGRTALILLVPIVAIQLVVSYVFIQRLYENVTRQMTGSILPSIALVLDEIATAPDIASGIAAAGPDARTLGLALDSATDDPVIEARELFDLSGRVVARTLREALPGVSAIDLGNGRRVRFAVDTPTGPVAIGFARSRVSASNPHQLLVLMGVVSAIATGVSFLFLKNQVRPIRRLAEAATAFGRGRILPYAPSGASEVRLAGAAFLDMRARIERHIEQRTLLLSGVSHDLRTPLTRLKLGLSMLPENEDTSELRRDVDEMQAMLDTFLGYARLDATEEAEPVDPVDLAHGLVDRLRRGGAQVELRADRGLGTARLRPLAVERAVDNLLSNALRYGTRARLDVTMTDRTLRFRIEDDGPGIPADRREEARRPFIRLDAARNQDQGGGVGLGLAIVSDIARQHGGALRLGISDDLGGLQADLVLSR